MTTAPTEPSAGSETAEAMIETLSGWVSDARFERDAALARAEQAEAERDEWKNGVFLQVEHTKTLTGKLISERDTALAEVARLREALESICRTIFVPERTEPGDLQKAVELTIAALKPKETP